MTTMNLNAYFEYAELLRPDAMLRTSQRLAAMQDRIKAIRPLAQEQVVAYWQEELRKIDAGEHIGVLAGDRILQRLSAETALRRAISGEHISTAYPSVCLPKRDTGKRYNDGSPVLSNEPDVEASCHTMAEPGKAMCIACPNCGKRQWEGWSGITKGTQQ